VFQPDELYYAADIRRIARAEAAPLELGDRWSLAQLAEEASGAKA